MKKNYKNLDYFCVVVFCEQIPTVAHSFQYSVVLETAETAEGW